MEIIIASLIVSLTIIVKGLIDNFCVKKTIEEIEKAYTDIIEKALNDD